MPELAEVLASHKGCGYVVAPAGFGKTYLIAKSVGHSDSGRQLVLTHTYAGVHALRRKMRDLSVPSTAYQLDTIASWALRLSLSYNQTSGWSKERPESNAEWNSVYAACLKLLEKDFIRRIVRASYVGLYVDEYQDCGMLQHEIVLKLSRDLSCRLLGDPLQAIFNFKGQETVDWVRDVEGSCEHLGRLDTPHRWSLVGAQDVGVWLQGVRQKLENGLPIELSTGLPSGVTYEVCNDDKTQGNVCRYFDADGTVIAIHKGTHKNHCHTLAKNLSGKFASLEEIEGKELFTFFAAIETASANGERLKQLVEFAAKTMTAVNSSLSAATRRGESVVIGVRTKNRTVSEAANAYLADPSSSHMKDLFISLKAVNKVYVVRADLFNRAIGVLRKHILHPELTFMEAAQKYQGEFRFKGRPIGHRKIIGTTLLVKGLEFDHAIVLDASSLSRNELYVALTRGSRTLTIISRQAVLNPSA